MTRNHPLIAHHLPRTLLVCLLLVVVYYLAPVEPDAAGASLVVRAIAATLGMGLTALLIVHLMSRVAREETSAGVVGLAVSLFGGLMVFAFIDYLVAKSGQGQFSGLDTKTDALYFAVTTLATVGYGDIYASGQAARVVVTVQQIFNLAVIATGASVLANHLARTARAGGTHGRSS